jgi:hypothetical protein
MPSKIVNASGIIAVKEINGGANLSIANVDDKLKYTANVSFEKGQPKAAVSEVVPASFTPYFAAQQSDYTTVLPFKSENGHAVLQLPESRNSISNVYGLSRPNTDRENNLLIPRLVDEEQDYTTILPEGASVSNNPVKKEIRNSAGTYSMELTKDGNQCRVKRSLKLNKQLYTPKEYKDVRELLINWNDSADRKLIINTK